MWPDRSPRATVALVAVAVAVAASALLAPAGALGWSSVPVPSAPLSVGELTSVTCPSTSFCLGAGSGAGSPLVEVDTAGVWSTVQTGLTGSASSVACASATSCLVVGSVPGIAGRQTARVASLSGTAWTLQTPALGRGWLTSSLTAVTCRSVRFCMAIGSESGRAGGTHLFAERWNGGHWLRVPIPTPAPVPPHRVTGIACATQTLCMAIGDGSVTTTQASGAVITKPEDAPFVEQWDGKHWTIADLPVTGSPSTLTSVSCPAARFCAAAGSSASGILLERWKGRRWTVWRAARPPRLGTVGTITCRSARACAVVGSVEPGPSGFVERWGGARWAVQTPTLPAGSRLDAVACPAASLCEIVGGQGASTPTTLAASLAGTSAAVQPTQNAATPAPGGLAAVSCPATGWCMAVGSATDTAGNRFPLAEAWSGGSWAIEPVPGGIASQLLLDGVSCTSPVSCVAVGYSLRTGAATIDHWDGAAWTSDSTSYTLAGAGERLVSVSCAAPDACTAVGSISAGGAALTPLALRWDGTAWASQPLPDLGGSSVLAVSCPTVSACEAVGDGSSGQPPVALGWTPAGWTIQATAATEVDGDLMAVACTTPTACSATGIDSADGPLIERWDGGAWTVQAPPVPGLAGILNGIACPASTSCTAVGAPQNTLAEAWDGTTWTAQPTVAPPGPALSGEGTDATPAGGLAAVSCTAPGACLAVGSYTTDAAGDTAPLAEIEP